MRATVGKAGAQQAVPATVVTPMLVGERVAAGLRAGLRPAGERDASTGEGAFARQRRLEDLLATIRLSRRVAMQQADDHAVVVQFPTAVVHGGRVWDLRTSAQPGLFPTGTHLVECGAVIDGYSISGTFEVAAGTSAPSPARWDVVHRGEVGGAELLPYYLAEQLACSRELACLAGASLRRAIRRVHSDAALAGAQLLDEHRGLVRSVVNRYRSVVASEDASLDIADLMLVGDHQLLEVAERYFCDPDRLPPRDVAWSKIVQRAVGNAVRAEIARVTGISVEFRQLLAWLHSHVTDRDAEPGAVAYRMAHAAGVTRLLAQRSSFDRVAGAAMLDEMLADGRAAYVEPGRDAAGRRRALRRAGVFVISPRSSLAEIRRAQEFAGPPRLAVHVAGEDGATVTDEAILAQAESGFEETEHRDCLRRTIEESGLSEIEALVWLHRSGALDPTGHGTELPEIATDLGLGGRAEARAALRRARRKLDAWTAGHDRLMIAG